MGRDEYPVTTAVRALRNRGISYVPLLYTWEEHGGTGQAARSFKVSEHEVIKTLVLMTDEKKCILLLMHGDREASLKQLARALGVKQVEMCDEPTAQKHTGYVFGGTSPFGTRQPLPVYAERSIFSLPEILINAGKRGFLVEISPVDLRKAFPVTEVEVALASDATQTGSPHGEPDGHRPAPDSEPAC